MRQRRVVRLTGDRSRNAGGVAFNPRTTRSPRRRSLRWIEPTQVEIGTRIMSVRPAVAVPACEAAVQKYPNDARLKYQLGRAYQKANNFIAAVAQYQKSATQQYAPAQNNLGFMYENGLGVPKDSQASECLGAQGCREWRPNSPVWSRRRLRKWQRGSEKSSAKHYMVSQGRRAGILRRSRCDPKTCRKR